MKTATVKFKASFISQLRFSFIRDHDRIRTCDRLIRSEVLYPAELRDHFTIKGKLYSKKNPATAGFFWSGWQDSNLRPPGPKPGAMTGLRYTPKEAERQGLEPWQRLLADRLAICSVTTPAPLLLYVSPKSLTFFAVANVCFLFN
jgi:hypothetical protein